MGSLKIKFLYTAFIITCFISVISCSKSATPTTPTPPTPTNYTLTVSVSPIIGGSIKISTPNITIDTQAATTITEASGTSVNITATPNSGYTFTGWGGEVVDKNAAITITLDKNTNITASFSKIPDPGNGTSGTNTPTSTNYTLTASVSPIIGGSIKISTPNITIDTQATTTITEASGTLVNIIATPNSGYTFTDWGGDVTDKSTTITITLDKNTNITASFSKVIISGPTTEQQKVFKEFWDIFDRHYPLMHRKNITWQSTFDAIYPQITSSTTDQDLVNHFTSIMNSTIKDGHTEITYNGSSIGYSEPANPNINDMISNSRDAVISFDPSSTSQNSPYILYGSLVSDPNIGYIKSLTFEPTKVGDAELALYKTHVNQALEALKNKKGIVLDVRENGGGQQEYAYYLSGRFFSLDNRPLRRARYKIKTGDTEASLSDWVTVGSSFDGYPDSRAEGGTIASTYPEFEIVSKSGTFQFTKKVALLTSRSTASSGEFFTAAMKSQPHVKTIGNTTNGIYAGSEILKLNAGNKKWSVRVSVQDVEVMFGGSFKSFEGVGIVPDQLLLPTAADANSGKDIHIDAAVTYINN